jgi:nucleotidyltransferase substrate binding protein (TIGR01987 family)
MKTIIEGIDFSPLLRARTNFETFRHDMITERDKAGAILAFGQTYELTWKLMQQILMDSGLTYYTPREIFRAAALEKLIKDPELWFDFLKMRALTEDMYEEGITEKIVIEFDSFSHELTDFLNRARVGQFA